jgi:site-specific DNA recombinase
VQRTASLARELERRGLEDPYEPVTGPLEGSGRQCRHLHARYRFEPLGGTPPVEEDRESA